MALDAHEEFVRGARSLYTVNVIWAAPGRGIRWEGRELVIRQLLTEAGGMHDPEFTPLRRNVGDRRIIDEFAVRFTYAGTGIENAPIATGDFVELKRVRVLEMHAGRCVQESCVESWVVLAPCCP